MRGQPQPRQHHGPHVRGTPPRRPQVRAVRGRELPDWATEFAASWGQFFLKYIVSHPAVTVVIPATSKPHHMVDNLGAGFGPLPDERTRRRMETFVDAL